MEGLILFILVVPYFLPSLIAFLRKRTNLAAIFALNLLLGWTLIGWVVSLVWALSKDTETIVVRERVAGDGAAPDKNPNE